MKFLLLLLIWALPAFSQVTNLTFNWDASSGSTGYKFYEIIGTNKLLLGITPTNSFIVSNWNVGASRTVTVSSTNVLGESAPASPLVVPPAPVSPLNLRPVPLSLTTPIPGVIEISQDLADWKQRLRFEAGADPSTVLVTWVTYPSESMMFGRQKAAPPVSTPPLP